MPEDSEEGDAEESPDNKESENTNSPQNQPMPKESSDTVELSVRSLIVGIFIMGLAIGFSGGILTGSGTDSVETENVGNIGSDDSPSDSGSPDTRNQDSGTQGETETINMDDIEIEGEPVLGQEDAPVTMVVYEDFECPFCKRFEEGAVQDIESNYVESGQVKIVWKDRPLTQLHPWAEPAAAAMECVYREGGNDVFWAVKDKVFANQDSVETSNVESQIKSWAVEEGASESAIQSCIDNDNPMEEVNADSSEGQELGASGTPTAFINGQKLVGAQPYSNLEPVIESALS